MARRESSKRKISEEDIQEYLAKKMAKKATRVANKLKSQTTVGYSNYSNPFGDPNVNEKFVWKKKIERDVAHGRVTLADVTLKAEKKRQKERMDEIERLKKRRVERLAEKAQREEELMLLQRERSRAEADDFEKKEEEVLLDLNMVKARIRLREGRAKPIDVLITSLDEANEFKVDLDEPCTIFKGLTLKEIEELHDDLKLHLGREKAKRTNYVEYWEALMVVCEWELGEARRKDAIDQARVRGKQPPAELLLATHERGMHSSVAGDVITLLEGKTYKDLVSLQANIESDMRSGRAKVVEYWEVLLRSLNIYKAKAYLKEIHHDKMMQRRRSRQDDNMKSKQITEEEVKETFSHEDGSFSPQLLHGIKDIEEAINPDEDNVMLEKKRLAVLKEQQKLKEAMEEGDIVLGSSAEVNLHSQVYDWQDRYHPRKPKYFNRVHSGYEWSKYNQTHYDHDNPPPKFVQGYKFNIFNPDLTNKYETPEYFMENDGDSTETCILRFHAGPPYEDIAFRIVNKEWERVQKKGFKCTFDRGILHLYFNFKRYRYRR